MGSPPASVKGKALLSDTTLELQRYPSWWKTNYWTDQFCRIHGGLTDLI